MFQTFEVTSRPEQGPPRLAALRAELARMGLAGMLVPRADAHQGEYVAACDARLAWLTGFTGSAGFAAVLPGIAGVFIDGRYRVQVGTQVDLSAFTPVHWPEVKLADWLLENAAPGARIGFDPWLHSVQELAKLREALDGKIKLVAVDQNPVDGIWAGRPPPPKAQAEAYPAEYAGATSTEKRRLCAEVLKAAGETAAVLTLPDSICWMLNIRGADIPRIPVVQCFAVLGAGGRVDLFIDPDKLEGLPTDPAVTVHRQESFSEFLGGMTGKVRIDPASAPHAVERALGSSGAEVTHGDDPCALPKACKTAAEIEGARSAQLRDGAAMCEFLAWLDAQPPGSLTEIDVVTKLEGFRRQTNALRDISFETISGAGPNGAIVHYRVSEETNRTVQDGELLLVDSGGQYIDGTTDITRTIAIGAPTADMRACFTRVLQGMIAISRARWPKGLAGRDLDPLARIHLWMAGQDYDHGTGHGVGAYLSVHEGPQRISRISEVPLAPGMILSNEPGYYRAGAFGIRIENLVTVRPAAPVDGGDAGRAMLDFETLTWVPIDRRLIDTRMLSAAERGWLDAYHQHCAARIGPRLGKAAQVWLSAATAPL